MSVWDDLKRPINIISLSVGFLSIIVSLFLYFSSLKSREPVFLIDEQRGKIFDSAITSPAIKVLDKDDHLIKEDVYLVTAAFWNAGELPIEPEHIRQPIKLKISPVKRLLDFAILKQVEPEISKIKLNRISESEVQLSWEHLDPGYGARLQLIYVGDKDSEISFAGKIINAEIKNVQPLGKKYKFIKVLLSIFPGFLFALIFENIKSAFSSFKSPNKSKASLNVIFATILVAASVLIYVVLFRGPSPPV